MVSIEVLVHRLVEGYQPERVLLFGSQAAGTARPHSDVDLLVIKQTSERFLDRLDSALVAMDPDRAVDVLVYTPDEFAEMQARGSPFLSRALRGARELYVRQPV